MGAGLPRCRITARLREQAAHESTERGITPAEAARHAGVSWPVAHEAFAAAAGPVLDQPVAPVAHLGIDEHRRGRARFAADEQTGEYTLLADRWHTCFFDPDGQQGLLGQVPGRAADDAAYWLAGATPAWRDAVQVVCVDMGSIDASAVRRMLPRAALTVDLFHVVQLAVKTVGDVRRRWCGPGTGAVAGSHAPADTGAGHAQRPQIGHVQQPGRNSSPANFEDPHKSA